jgi:hypothetical protein
MFSSFPALGRVTLHPVGKLAAFLPASSASAMMAICVHDASPAPRRSYPDRCHDGSGCTGRVRPETLASLQIILAGISFILFTIGCISANMEGSVTGSTVQQQWTAREQKLVEQVTSTIAWYSKHMRRNWYAQRAVSVTVMILSVFAPLFVIGSDFEVFGIDPNVIKASAIITTVLLALLEGMKRIFRFDHRWSACFWARNDLKKAREQYRIKQIGQAVGSATWVENLLKLTSTYYDITDKESRDLLQSVIGEGSKNGSTSPSSKTLDNSGDPVTAGT